MKIVVISDSHRRNELLTAVVRRETPFDTLIHCGDSECTLEGILGRDPGYKWYSVKGNCDYYSYPRELELTAAGHRILVLHGHEHNVRYSNSLLEAAGRKSRADVVLFGHTHVPEVEFRKGMLLLNPGSIALPRREPRIGTYALLTLEEGKQPAYEFRQLED